MTSRWPRWLLLVGPTVGAANQFGYNLLLPYTGLEGGIERMVSQALCSLLWIPLTPLVVRLAERLPLEGSRRARNLLLHCGAALLAVAVVYLSYFALRWSFHALTGWADYAWRRIPRRLASGGWLVDFLIFWAIAAVIHARRWREEVIRRSREAAALEARLGSTELRLLRAQLNPHFLFNTLNAISSMVWREPQTADRMISRLSEYLRLLLRTGDSEQLALVQELEHTAAYVDVQKARFGDRLQFEQRVPAELLSFRVPHLILQPLVENAIEHGMVSRRPLHVTVRARRTPGAIELTIEDDGRGVNGLQRQREGHHGVGLANTRARLRKLHGARANVELAERAGGGALVRLRLPAMEPVEQSNEEFAHEMAGADRR